MNGLRRRLERVERAVAPQGRLIVVMANDSHEAEQGMAAAGIEPQRNDTVLKIHRRIVDPPHLLGVHPEGITEFFASIDGRSVPLVREPA